MRNDTTAHWKCPPVRVDVHKPYILPITWLYSIFRISDNEFRRLHITWSDAATRELDSYEANKLILPIRKLTRLISVSTGNQCGQNSKSNPYISCRRSGKIRVCWKETIDCFPPISMLQRSNINHERCQGPSSLSFHFTTCSLPCPRRPIETVIAVTELFAKLHPLS